MAGPMNDAVFLREQRDYWKLRALKWERRAKGHLLYVRGVILTADQRAQVLDRLERIDDEIERLCKADTGVVAAHSTHL